MDRISIVVPCFNERGSVAGVLSGDEARHGRAVRGFL